MRLPQSKRYLSFRLFSYRLFFLCMAAGCISMSTAQTSTSQLQLQCAPSYFRFGTVVLGQSETQVVVLANTGQSSVTISAIASSVSEFGFSGVTLPLVIPVGQTAAVNLVFAPTVKGWTGGEITFTSNASNPALHFQVAGAGVTSDSLTASPSSLSFGPVSVGSSATLPVVLTNQEPWQETLTGLTMIGTGFSASGPTFPLVLSAGQTATLNITFTPQAGGLISGSILVTGPALNIPLIGTGSTLGQLSIAPGSLSFGNVDVGNTNTQSSTLSATGGSVTIASAASTNSAFTISGVSFPLTISAGQNTSFSVVFTPKTSGTTSGTLTLTSNASNSQVTESVSGNGVLPTYSISLSWNPSVSSVVGYNVYRGTTVGTYSKVNSTLDPLTSYTDNSVSSGVTYYYVATSVNSAGEESTYSTPPLQVTVP